MTGTQAAVADNTAISLMGRAEAGQYLTFMLGKEMFAIGILGIKEIIEYGALTKVPMMPNFICGVINLRGRVVPVIDLAARFERPTAAITRRTCIVIVELELDAEIPAQHIGVLVDTVNEVVDIAAADIEPAPRFGTHIRTDFIKGLGRRGELFVILLNVQNALSMADISALE